MINSQINDLSSGIKWAEGLNESDLKWMLLLLAEDTPALNKWQRKGVINEAILRMGL